MIKPGPGILKANGLEIWHTVQGTGPICFVPSPGWGLSVDEYINTLPELARMFTLVFIDSRGSGRSQRPPTTKDYRYADFAKDFEELRLSLGLEKLWLFGHSLGGVLAMQYALDYPASVAGLLLVDTYAESDAAYRADVERRKNLRSKESWFKSVDFDAMTTDAQMMDGILATLPLYFHDHYKMQDSLEKFAGGSCSLHALRGWQDSEGREVHLLPRLPAVKCPTLMLVGESDFICSPMNSERIYAQISGSQLRVIREAGHFPWIEQPRAFFTSIQDFLGRHA